MGEVARHGPQAEAEALKLQAEPLPGEPEDQGPRALGPVGLEGGHHLEDGGEDRVPEGEVEVASLGAPVAPPLPGALAREAEGVHPEAAPPRRKAARPLSSSPPPTKRRLSPTSTPSPRKGSPRGSRRRKTPVQ